MQSAAQLQDLLRSINRKSYPAYKSTKGTYQFKNYILSIDHVQGDPFASPSHISVRIRHTDSRIPAEYYQDTLTKITLADFLTRQFERQVSQYTFRAKGSGKSGLILVTHCGQEVLSRTACQITDQEIVVRFFIGFPANGRTINSAELEKILFEFLPVCVQKSFFYRNLNSKELEKHIHTAQDQEYIRQQLPVRHLCAFVADNAILPRESGISSKPMKNCVPFASPESLRITMELPHHGTITGMGIPWGITLIVGGGYHGKSTLLNALELGVYNHIPGDGREYVITDISAQKLRSEDGRFIKDVDLYTKAGISTILVAGSSGAFFHIADTVIQMDNYVPVDITSKVKKLCLDFPLPASDTPDFVLPKNHRIMTKAPTAKTHKDYYGNTRNQPERLKIKNHGCDGFSLGRQEIDLRYIEQLIDSEQTASLGLLLKYAAEHLIDGKRTIDEIIAFLASHLEKEGLAFFFDGYTSCGYAIPRIQEIYSCFNRYRRP